MKKTENSSADTGKLKGFFSRIRLPFRITFILAGITSTVWFLVRVIPKPSRASYPCMQAAAPVMSGFIVWLISFSASIAGFKSIKKITGKMKFIPALLFFMMVLAFSFLSSSINIKKSSASNLIYQTEYEVNQPFGNGQGFFPGRVVWAWDSAATNENQGLYENGDGYIDENDDYYFLLKNNNQSVIDSMVACVVRGLTGESSISASWDALFKYHNKKKKGSEISYSQIGRAHV